VRSLPEVRIEWPSALGHGVISSLCVDC